MNIEHKQDSDYRKFREQLQNGETLPYREYVYVRAIYFIRYLATKKELEHLAYEVKKKTENYSSLLS